MHLVPVFTQTGARVCLVLKSISPVLRVHLDQFTVPQADALIFTGSRGGIVRRSNFRRAAQRDESTREIGSPGVHFHDLRHIGKTIAARSDGFSNRLSRTGYWHVDGTKPRFHDRTRGFFCRWAVLGSNQ
ncbi:hypothetical protein [Nonomuraea sp. NPDC003201]